MLSTIADAYSGRVVSLSLASYLVGHTHQLRYILCYTRDRGPEAHASRGLLYSTEVPSVSDLQLGADRQFLLDRYVSSRQIEPPRTLGPSRIRLMVDDFKYNANKAPS